MKCHTKAVTTAGFLILLGLGSCAERRKGVEANPQHLDPALFATDVFKVVCFYPSNMWQSFDKEGNLDPEGFAFVMYPLSRATGKGAYVQATLHVSMYAVERDARKRTTRTLAREWTVPTSELAPRSRTKFGVGYDVYLYWGDADVYGREIEIVVQLELPNGRIIQSQTRQAKVPARKAEPE